MVNAIAANLVWLLHMLLCIFLLIVPFIPDSPQNTPLLFLHLFAIPCLWLHWIMADDTCALTLLECKLRGVNNTESFFHSVVSPVYKIEDDEIRTTAWTASVVLWLITLSRFVRKPEMLTEVWDHFRKAFKATETPETADTTTTAAAMV